MEERSVSCAVYQGSMSKLSGTGRCPLWNQDLACSSFDTLLIFGALQRVFSGLPWHSQDCQAYRTGCLNWFGIMRGSTILNFSSHFPQGLFFPSSSACWQRNGRSRSWSRQFSQSPFFLALASVMGHGSFWALTFPAIFFKLEPPHCYLFSVPFSFVHVCVFGSPFNLCFQ